MPIVDNFFRNGRKKAIFALKFLKYEQKSGKNRTKKQAKRQRFCPKKSFFVAKPQKTKKYPPKKNANTARFCGLCLANYFRVK